MYGAQANSFTIKGRINLYSGTGVSFSILHVIAVICFAVLKLYFVFTGNNPDIAVFD